MVSFCVARGDGEGMADGRVTGTRQQLLHPMKKWQNVGAQPVFGLSLSRLR